MCLFLPQILIAQELPQEIGGIVNAYSKVTNIDTLCDFVEVLNPEHFAPGDKVLLIQMQGAQIQETNNTSFGNVVQYREAGNYEYADVILVLGNRVYLISDIVHNYDPSESVQLVKTPVYNNVRVMGRLSCTPWNGDTGGIISIIATGTLELRAEISVKGMGFRGGRIIDFPSNQCTLDDFFASRTQGIGGQKGEGISRYIPGKDYARGKNANGGGGGNVHNSGGGGGSNAGEGGKGGSEWNSCSILSNNAGVGGGSINYLPSAKKIFMGGGGGGGNQNDGVGTDGVSGGGIIILQFNRLISNNQTMDASGQSQSLFAGVDSGGGGGAGGTILLSGDQVDGNLRVISTGGKGGGINASGYSMNDQWGTGGGGGGGLLWLSNSLSGATINTMLQGGTPGDNPILSNWGATMGQPGKQMSGLEITEGLHKEDIYSEKQLFICPESASIVLNLDCNLQRSWIVPYSDTIITANELFVPNVDTTLKIIGICGDIFCPDSIVIFNLIIEDPIVPTELNKAICNGEVFEFNGQSYTSPGIYPFTLSNDRGCDSTIIVQLTVNETYNQFVEASICEGMEYNFNGETISIEGEYIAQLQSEYGCDSIVTLQLDIVHQIDVELMATICEGETYSFGGQSLSVAGIYTAEINDPNGCDTTAILDLRVNAAYHEQIEAFICNGESYTYNGNEYVTQGVYVDSLLTNSGCDSIFRLSLTVSSPDPDLGSDRSFCPEEDTIFLSPGIFSSYIWNDGTTTAQIEVKSAGRYSVKVSDQFGCIAIDSIILQEHCDLKFFIPDAFSPNLDGINEWFQVYFNQLPKSFELQIYDRWGERMALITDPMKGWDGQFKGKDAPSAVYVWLAKIDGNTYSGDVFLYR